MKILHTADWHLGTLKSPVKDGVNLRTEDLRRCLDELIRVAKEERPDFSLVSGDVFNVGHLWSDRCCKEIITAVHYIRSLSLVSGQVVVMRGTPNHDGIGQFNVLSEMFADYKNVHIVTTPQVLRFEEADIAVLPGFDHGTFRAECPGLSKEEENEELSQELSNILFGLKAQCRWDRKNILMAHSTVPGCNMESGQSMMLTQFEPVLTQESLLAAGFDLVALGHIHRPQEILRYNWFYSGAINAINFRDEGQERGFWIHETDSGIGVWTSEFYHTPIREFVTIRFTDTDVTAINIGNIDEVALNHWRINGAVQDRIVRILYSCTEENSRALKMNEALLQNTLLDDGAFMVWEVSPEKIIEVANRKALADKTDPETNLVRYLEEKQIPSEKIEELVIRARPLIAEAEAGMPTAANTGTFEPVEISVRNYRNYEDETFNFEDITFCTINGQNGAGKSSLFMDAILDCLYEQPREGIIKDDSGKAPWLRNDEKARSGSIIFIFRIGEKKYRVTRTRSRSGKGTLNISELLEGEWVDRSKERYNDTQQEIMNVIGMDSFTFKSCALIMQDQYGLFLQAKPEERIEVLGTLLGLGVYQAMERIAHDRARENGAKGRELKQEIEIHNNTIASFGKTDEELALCRTELTGYESRLQIEVTERDQKKLILANQQAASERRARLLTSVSTLQNKKNAIEQSRVDQQAIADSSAVILDDREEIESRSAEYRALLKRELELAGESALYSSRKRDAEKLAKQAEEEQAGIDQFRDRLKKKEAELASAQPTDQDAVIRANVAEYERQKKLLDNAYEKERTFRSVEQKLTQARHSLEQILSLYDADIKHLKLREESLKKKAELLSNVECVDIANAKCGFLADAISAKQALEKYPERYMERRKACEEQSAPINSQIAELEKQISEMGFDSGEVEEISRKVSDLKPYVDQLEIITQRERQIALLEADIRYTQSNILAAEKRLTEARLKGAEAQQECDQYAKAFEEHTKVLSMISALEPWLEKERQLPVAEERNLTAQSRIRELTADLVAIDIDISEKQAEADRELFAVNGMEELTRTVAQISANIDVINELIKEKQMKIGALQQKAEQITRLKQEIAVLQEKQMEYVRESTDYDILRTAFSQSGVPHQIIRSIIPQLTFTANTILGQMTAGKMGVEFRLERLQKNGKEKVSLDIFIEEYGKSVLPYLSKSGGEKVKSSLSVILALAEIKSSSAGIRLGMLFIDEPPFLDGDGIQAYCDALETIQIRYQDIKIMAITHDPTMKARFPQNLDVIKTETGSHVKWG